MTLKKRKMTLKPLNVKQIIIVRKDLGMRKGKIAAQVAHGSSLAIMQHAVFHDDGFNLSYQSFGEHSEAVKQWQTGLFTKIVVTVNSLEELEQIENIAKEKGLISAKITDSGKTEFHGIPTVTVLALGPMESSYFEGITDNLKLL